MRQAPGRPRSTIPRLLVIALGTALTTACAHVRPAQSWPELVPRLSAGAPVTVTDASGTVAQGRVVSVTDGVLAMDVDGNRRTFDASGVREVRRHGDPLWNGLAIGAAVGLVGAALGDNRCIEQPGGTVACNDTQMAQRIAFFGIAAGAGLALDALHKDSRVLYRAPSWSVRGRAAVGARGAAVFCTIAIQ